ncbi:hypothetical protein FY145_21885 [Agrobacterium tumefaciens]|uniref:Uncharacterized protein n=1 Tax=Agrobacterium tumefaciens TaxID=358 RepID=A0AAP9INI5_AGRTU|nr:hypothetical protein [Agrobacterium tumefaciens]NSZ60480.1 hypothetical protein [Agrobacterium tumefaciens]QHW12006.1 hypothetical protein CG010_28060 [Agrobacterium tumefaciens]UXS47082.1 hypothetical protein FY149_07595 [Agrobacterium tumefaciens]UXS72336.1 hypothetical protein FY146_17335 [Agrobacterium tumefaciens]UXS80828.1 hypothetical protein FY145_21885 [Agrobacterium tumefaciens]
MALSQASILLADESVMIRSGPEADQPLLVEVFSSVAGQFANSESPPAGLSSKDRR